MSEAVKQNISSHNKQYSAGLFIPLDWYSLCVSVTTSPVWENLPRFPAWSFTAGCPHEVLPQFSAHSEHTKQVGWGKRNGKWQNLPRLAVSYVWHHRLCRGAKESQHILDSGNSANSIMPAVNKSDRTEQIPTLYRPITHWVIHRVKKARKRNVINAVYVPW